MGQDLRELLRAEKRKRKEGKTGEGEQGGENNGGGAREWEKDGVEGRQEGAPILQT